MTIRQASEADCALIYSLAVPAWEYAYSEILSKHQFDYMIELMYSKASLKKQMQQGHIFFIANSDENEPVGFISIRQKTAAVYILEKLYVVPNIHNSGVGRFLVESIEKYIRREQPGQHHVIELNVNRRNKAVGFYNRLGFQIERLVDEDIGNGFSKNDYIMSKIID